jgi:hypothetical protein
MARSSDTWDDFDGMAGIVIRSMPRPFRIEIRLLPGQFVGELLGFLDEYDVSLIFDDEG